MKKMCFSERFGLHDAVLEGRKTHTRRMIPLSALAKIEAFQREYYEATLDRLDGIELLEQYYIVEEKGKLPFKVGDIVAVAQRYCSILDELEDPPKFLLHGALGVCKRKTCALRRLSASSRLYEQDVCRCRRNATPNQNQKGMV